MAQALVSDFTLHGSKLYGKVHAKITGRGAFSFGPELGYERIDLPAESGKPTAREFLDFLPATFLYTRSISTGPVLFNGKSWVSVTLAGAGSVHSLAPGFAYQAEALSPEFALDEIVWGAKSAKSLGSPIVNHVPMAKYLVSVDLDQAMSKATGAMKAAIGEEITATGSHTTSITVWVDGPGHVVQLTVPLPGSGLGSISMTLSGYGAKLPTTLPADSTILKITGQTAAGGDLLRSTWIFPAS